MCRAGFLGDAPQRERVAAKTDARHVDQRPAPHLLEDAGLVGGEVLIREHEVVEAPAPVHEHPRKGVEVYRSVGIGAPLRVLRLMKEPPQIHDQVLVHHGDAELLGRHGPEDRLRLPRNTRVPHRGLRCQPRWASVLPWGKAYTTIRCGRNETVARPWEMFSTPLTPQEGGVPSYAILVSIKGGTESCSRNGW